MLNKLTEALESTHTVIAPDMPNPEDPSYAEWAEEIGVILSDLDHVILAGHSLGGSALLKYLSEQRPRINIRALYIISSPMWGLDEKWQKADFMFEKGFEKSLPSIKHLALYHSEYDSVVPLEHHVNYRKALNADEIEVTGGDSHIFREGLPGLVRSIQALKE